MLSARGEEYDKLFGFEVGADDYVTKPFSPKELMARINVIIKRHGKPGAEQKPVQLLQFGGLVINIDGHNFDQIRAAFAEARETKGMPTAIIAKTTKGKGVSFMENQVSWHGVAPNDEQFATAMEELERTGETL